MIRSSKKNVWPNNLENYICLISISDNYIYIIIDLQSLHKIITKSVSA